MPVISHDSPYTSPFSAPAWYCAAQSDNDVLVAARANGQLDVRASDCTWDQLDEEGKLSRYVREQRAAICMDSTVEALYSLPLVIKKMLQRVAVNLDDRLVVAAFSPILQSVRSWLIAKRLSINYNINPAARIGAQCMLATISASQPPPDVQAPAIIMRQLRIDEAHPQKPGLLRAPSKIHWQTRLRLTSLSPSAVIGPKTHIGTAAIRVMRYLRHMRGSIEAVNCSNKFPVYFMNPLCGRSPKIKIRNLQYGVRVTSFDRELKSVICGDRQNTTVQGLIAECHTRQQIHGGNRKKKRGKHWGNSRNNQEQGNNVEEEIYGDRRLA
ncbi:hypothetical protein BGY98DRAFT_935608 [Russula aff. rugulosa BPL654]|nr:hypothetical protein BGY98DRAFT_935608 [Russula aff. rugulosa BPL654]